MKLAAPVQSKLALADAQPAWKVGLDGRMDWGPGGATATDTALYRSAANQLATPGGFFAGGKLLLHTDGAIYFGAAQDTILYRSGGAPAGLVTNGNFLASSWGGFSSGTNQVLVGEVSQFVGGAARPGVIFGAAQDTNLYRLASGNLKTDGTFQAAGSLVASTAGAGAIYLRNDSGRIYWGVNDDTSLYRSQANALQTDGSLYVKGNAIGIGLVFNPTSAAGNPLAALAPGDTNYRYFMDVNGRMNWGPGTAASDVSLYRSGGGQLTTQGFTCDYLYVDAGSVPYQVLINNGSIYFGNATDVYLYRSSAGQLNVVGNLLVTGSLSGALTDSSLRLSLHKEGGDNQPADLNTFVENGWAIANGVTNIPPGSSGQFLIEQHQWSGGASGYGVQMAYGLNDTSVWKRRLYGGTWGGWVQVGFGDVGETTFYRASALNLRTNGSLTADNSVIVDNSNAGNNRLYFGSALDAYIYRLGAGSLQSNSSLGVRGLISNGVSGAWAYWSSVDGEAQPRHIVGVDGLHSWGPGGSVAQDTNLYRSSAGVLATDSAFLAGGTIQANARGFFNDGIWVDGGVARFIGCNGNVVGIYNSGWRFGFGPDDVFSLVGTAGKITIGNDTNLYRSAAATLKTDGGLYVQKSIVMDNQGSGNPLYFGNAGDTYLSRKAAATIRANGDFHAVQAVYGRDGANVCMYGPNINHWKMLGNSSVVTTDSNGIAFVPFGETVGNCVTAVAVSGDYNVGNIYIGVRDLTTTGFYIKPISQGTNTVPNQGIRVNWTALCTL